MRRRSAGLFGLVVLLVLVTSGCSIEELQGQLFAIALLARIFEVWSGGGAPY